eukprot:CAMPEP_0195067732 /NCGR_PEP_ID=MMETSP0448-20130528/12699_1 /TAXON_ID=66468 /ORGANISM="Heterocapsa triquestra, Strain CCMP 448" /LENGTH=70 /DNA_ID=CAMNT_0040099179 /DNA_START=56 /DNA_END=265 /DNA_ORIENTATION=+
MAVVADRASVAAAEPFLCERDHSSPAGNGDDEREASGSDSPGPGGSGSDSGEAAGDDVREALTAALEQAT